MPRALVPPTSGLFLLALVLLALRDPPHPAASAAPRASLYSLLAVGDTGKRPGVFSLFDTLPNVAEGLARGAEREPVEGLVLLGDNFYPDGLEPGELEERLAENVASPFCPFVRLGSPELPALTRACPPAERRSPVPIYAVLGNLDEHSPTSAFLQREIVPRYVPSWRMPRGAVETFELPHGLSLVLVGASSRPDAAAAAEVTRAVAETRGSWRIVALHHPLHEEPAAVALRRAIDAAGVPVHLVLAGHEHSPQALEIGAPGPALEIVSGSGANVDAVPPGGPKRLYTAERPGFARVDLVPGAGAPRLVVSIVAAGGRGVW
jgi:hypothetical protein